MTAGTHGLLPLAHSPRRAGESGDPYVRHVNAVRDGARQRAEAMLCHAMHVPPGLLAAIVSAATFHDLGKLDADTQARWWMRVKDEWKGAQAEGRPFANPLVPRTLRWRAMAPSSA